MSPAEEKEGTDTAPYPDHDKLPTEARECLDRLPSQLNVFPMIAHTPTTVAPVAEARVRLLSTLTLPEGLRELTILRIGPVTGADYVWVQHLPAARSARAGNPQIATVRDGHPTNLCFSTAESEALRFADGAATGRPITGGDIAGPTGLFTTRQTVELTVLAGYYLMLARILTALDADIDPTSELLAQTFVKPAQTEVKLSAGSMPRASRLVGPPASADGRCTCTASCSPLARRSKTRRRPGRHVRHS